MKVLVVSDTHGKNDRLYELVEQERPELLIHLGDSEGYEAEIMKRVSCMTAMVRGNCDYFSNLVYESDFKIGPLQCFLTHGHYYGANFGTDGIEDEARARGAQIAMYGHTHVPLIRKKNGLLIMNPGSLSYPRQIGRKPSYIIMNIDDEWNVDAQIHYVER